MKEIKIKKVFNKIHLGTSLNLEQDSRIVTLAAIYITTGQKSGEFLIKTRLSAKNSMIQWIIICIVSMFSELLL